MSSWRTWILLVVMAGGCSSERQWGAYDSSTHTWNTPEGRKVEDRVSRKLIDPKLAVQREYLGAIYYFENASHAEMFDRNPGAYAYSGEHD